MFDIFLQQESLEYGEYGVHKSLIVEAAVDLHAAEMPGAEGQPFGLPKVERIKTCPCG